METLNTNNQRYSREELATLFRDDLSKATDSFGDTYEAKNKWEVKTGLSVKTFDRYIKGKTTPVGLNVYKSYKFILDLEDLSEIERIAPSHAKQLHDLAIKQKDSAKKEELASRALETEIEIKLFLNTMNGNYVNKNDFIKAWGEKQAVSAFDKLEDMDIITQVEGSFYRRGSLNSNFSAKDISSFLKHLINSELSHNDLSEDNLGTMGIFTCNNFSDEGLRQYSELIWETARKIDQLEQAHPGNNIVFCGIASKANQSEGLQ